MDNKTMTTGEWELIALIYQQNTRGNYPSSQYCEAPILAKCFANGWLETVGSTKNLRVTTQGLLQAKGWTKSA